MKNRIVYFVAFLITCLVVSCSEHTNDDKYQSRVPRFSKIVAQESEIKVGETIVFTAVQREAGHLLDRTTYTWTITPQNVSKSKASVPINGVYDGVNPTDTVVFTAPGKYTIVLQADYHGMGNVTYFEDQETLESGGKAKYSANTYTGTSVSRDYLHATLTETFNVK